MKLSKNAKRKKRMKARKQEEVAARAQTSNSKTHLVPMPAAKRGKSAHKTDEFLHGDRQDRGAQIDHLFESIGIKKIDPQMRAHFIRLAKNFGGGVEGDRRAIEAYKKLAEETARELHNASQAPKRIKVQVSEEQAKAQAERKGLVFTPERELSPEARAAAQGFAVEERTWVPDEEAFPTTTPVTGEADVPDAGALELEPVQSDTGDASKADQQAVLSVLHVMPDNATWAELKEAAKKKRKGAKGYVTVLTAAGFELNQPDDDPRLQDSWHYKSEVAS